MPREDDVGVELEVEEVQAVTDKAILIVVDDEKHWLPKGQIHPDSEMTEDAEQGDSGTITVTTWWAEKEGLG